MSPSLTWLIPVFFLIVAVEWLISVKQSDGNYTLNNTAMNIAIGAIDRLGSLLTMALLYLVLDYTYSHFALFHLQSSWYQWLCGYIAVDFVSYWFHRYSHEVSILWAGHVTHHSSPKFNLSNGFRTSVFQGINRIPFWVILPMLGFSPIVLIIIFNISGIYDFFMHTPYFPRVKWIETVLITPSLHKVHHGKNTVYIDKNYGSTLSVWDRLFGTFQPEAEEVEFGITGNYKDEKPLTAIMYYYHLLFNAVKKAPRNVFGVLFTKPSNNNFVSSACSMASLKKAKAPGNMLFFALFTLISGVAIDFGALVCKHNIHTVTFLIFYGIGLAAIISAVRILNSGNS